MQNLVVQHQRRVRMTSEEPIVFERLTGVFGYLVDVYPALLQGRGQQVDCSQPNAQHGTGRCTYGEVTRPASLAPDDHQRNNPAVAAWVAARGRLTVATAYRRARWPHGARRAR